MDQHLANHVYEEENTLVRQDTATEGRDSHFVAGEEVSVIIVKIKDVRISDFKGTVRDWAIVPEGSLVNGH